MNNIDSGKHFVRIGDRFWPWLPRKYLAVRKSEPNKLNAGLICAY